MKGRRSEWRRRRRRERGGEEEGKSERVLDVPFPSSSSPPPPTSPLPLFLMFLYHLSRIVRFQQQIDHLEIRIVAEANELERGVTQRRQLIDVGFDWSPLADEELDEGGIHRRASSMEGSTTNLRKEEEEESG